MSEMQRLVQEAADELVDSGAERGLQVAVYRHGEPVVDVVAGVADARTGRRVTAGTPFYGFSVGKGMTATVAHVLAARGAFGYDTPIAELWPEFAARGKGAATVRHALTHTVGVPAVPPGTTPEDLCDWHRMCALIADAEPWWEPGTKIGYHSYTFGYIVGEIVRRATGTPISQVLAEEVAAPLGVAGELYFGVPAAEQDRLAWLEDAEGAAEALAAMPADEPIFEVSPRTVFPDAAFGNRPDVLAADIPATGKMSARAIARMYAALLGEVDGVRLVGPERLREISAVAFDDVDQIMGTRFRAALGYGLGRLGADPGDDGLTVFGMPGAGGGYACADTATGTAFALTKNRLTADLATAGRIAGLVHRAVAAEPSRRHGPPGRS